MSIEQQKIDTGDSVFHAPTGYELVVAYVRDDKFAWLGWPPGEGWLKDITLVEKATDEYREETLRRMAKIKGNDPRWSYARRRLELMSGDTKP